MYSRAIAKPILLALALISTGELRTLAAADHPAGFLDRLFQTPPRTTGYSANNPPTDWFEKSAAARREHPPTVRGQAPDPQTCACPQGASPYPTIDMNGKNYYLVEPAQIASLHSGNASHAGGGAKPAGAASDSSDDGGGAGAAAAVDPSVPLAQFSFQNVFIPSSRGGSGYANQFILQPVIPINLNSSLFPYHIIRPTLPILNPADPDGPVDPMAGIGDLTMLDVFIHPIKELKTNVGPGYVVVFPTASNAKLGRREWQVGPSFAVITKIVPKWIFGVVSYVPMSVNGDAYSVQTQLIATRLFEDNWYVGWGDQLFLFDDENGGYQLPLSMKVGKVVTVGKQPLNIFVQAAYTPAGFQRPGGDEWNLKISITPLLPGLKLGPIFGSPE